MQFVRLIDLRALFFDLEIFCQLTKELLLTKSVQILHHAVIVDNVELVIRETNGQEIIKLSVLIACRFLLFGANAGRCR